MSKSNAYALTFSITDTETGETKATASVLNCLRSALEDGSAANQISYDLMKGYGIALDSNAKTRLTQKTAVMAAETSAQVSMAKGIVAEQSGSNIEALTYYIQARKSDKNYAEVANRIATMTTAISGGNFGTSAKNMIKMRDDWDKLLRESAELIAAYSPEFELHYFTDIEAQELTADDYDNGTMSFTVSMPQMIEKNPEESERVANENEKIINEFQTALRGIPQSKNWGDKINGFPWTYADDIPGDNWLKSVRRGKETYSFAVSLLDDKKKTIAKTNIAFTVTVTNKFREFSIANNKRVGNYDASSLTFSKVAVNDADTNRLYITVENIGNKKISVLPTDALPIEKATAVIKSGNHSGMVKIWGNLGHYSLNSIGDAVKSGKKAVAVDLTGLLGITKIEKDMFKDCTTLTGIVIPDSVTEICESAFYGCNSLASLNIPDTVTKIGNSAFGGCTSLTNVLIPDSVTEICKGAFADCTALTGVMIPDGVAKIDGAAFSGCTSLMSVVIPDSVTEIGHSAFFGCTSLASVSIPNSVTKIDEQAFARCTSLVSVNIPDSVTVILHYAFFGCTSLASVNIPDSVIGLGLGVFSNCTSLVSVIIPNSVKKVISEDLFNGCTSLVNVIIGGGLGWIDKTMFKGCTSLRSISIPTSVVDIPDNAFKDCTSLEKVDYKGSKKQWKNIKIGKNNKPLLNAQIECEDK